MTTDFFQQHDDLYSLYQIKARALRKAAQNIEREQDELEKWFFAETDRINAASVPTTPKGTR